MLGQNDQWFNFSQIGHPMLVNRPLPWLGQPIYLGLPTYLPIT
jgi:hypothetical protein